MNKINKLLLQTTFQYTATYDSGTNSHVRS